GSTRRRRRTQPRTRRSGRTSAGTRCRTGWPTSRRGWPSCEKQKQSWKPKRKQGGGAKRISGRRKSHPQGPIQRAAAALQAERATLGEIGHRLDRKVSKGRQSNDILSRL